MTKEKIIQAKTKAEAYSLMSLDICEHEALLIMVTHKKTQVITKNKPDLCFYEGFKQGLAFALQGVAEGRINMQIVEPEPPEPKPDPKCTVCWKPQGECDGGKKEMTTE